MAFGREKSRIPSGIGKLIVRLVDNPDGRDEAYFRVYILDGDGDFMGRREGNLVPHLAPSQINQLKSFMLSLRTKAEEEILP